MPYIYGKRIRLRAAEKEDIPTFLRWFNDPEVTENLMMTTPMARVEEESWYDCMMQKPATEHVMVIEISDGQQKPSYRAIGTCGFISIDWRNRSSEVGISIGEKSLWDQGYGTETMSLLIEHGFNTLNLHRIWLQVHSTNPRGIRAYEKAGFIHEGKFRQAEFKKGAYCDVHVMSILADEWRQSEIKGKPIEKGLGQNGNTTHAA